MPGPSLVLPAAGLILAAAISSTDAASPASRKILEPGFRVTHSRECGFQGPAPTGPPQRARDLIADAECSPGGPWGDFVYLAVTEFWTDADFDPQSTMKIERVDPRGRSELFSLLGQAFQVPQSEQLSFTPLGWRGGDQLLFTLKSHSQNLSIIRVLDPQAVTLDHIGRFYGGTGTAAVDPSGAFGNDLFWQSDYHYPPESWIFRVDAAGVETVFADLVIGEMRFGPGGDWGTDLYVAGFTFAPDATRSTFPVEFTEFDWAPGPGFGGDMFGRIRGEDPGTIFRIEPNGSYTPFARNLPGSITACATTLWVVNQQGCFIVEKQRRTPAPRDPLLLGE